MRVPLNTVLVDVLLAVVLAGLSVATLAGQADGRPDWRAAVLGVLTVAPLALRQRAPVLTTLVIVAALAAYSLLGYGEFPNGGVGMVVAMFTVATLRSRPVAAAVFATTIAATAIAYATATSAVVWSQIAQSVLVMLGAWVLGEGTRRWGRRAERLAAEAAQLVAGERVRIARELHDIVAHHMSVISLQAGVAEYVLDTDLPTARTAIATVGGASREALLDLRRLLDVLRVDDVEGSQLQPQPGLAQLPDLVERIRGAGLPVEVAVTGEARPLPPGPDLCAYRVVQESLTNVLKHAGPATARVHVEHGERTLTVRVTDDGAVRPHQRAQHRPATSHGIRGMRERAELYGGVLTAGPADGGGFAVVLRLPTEVSL
ncbi:histidine kinase [Dactylosporangium sp. NBC_01737]|uniref:sensor histidine kinase n=1 Tax=Dactylosporangium sp. NBC_01737 TaxID=2975959 RepID=UPI002E0F3DF1|nr:histidine kinase [Dactylosporangium sp. NBC_01737]